MGRLIEYISSPDAIRLATTGKPQNIVDILKQKKAPSMWPKGRIGIEAADPMCMSLKIAGYVYVDLIHAKTGLIKRHLEFPNVITTSFLNTLGANTSGSTFMAAWVINGWIGVGTGNATPSAADTSLQTATGVRTQSQGGGTTTTGIGAANAYHYCRVVREFTEAQSNGNLTEFGMFNASSSGVMLCRQLFKDGGGSPTEIVKTSDDKLRITYEYRIYPPTVDGSGGPITINAANYNYTSRAGNIGIDTAWGFGGSGTGLGNHLGDMGANVFSASVSNGTGLGATTGTITGATQSGSFSSSSKSTYTTGDFYWQWTAIMEPGVCNFTGGVPGVRAFNFQPFGSSSSVTHQLVLDTHIPKVNTQRLTMVFRLAFAAHTI